MEEQLTSTERTFLLTIARDAIVKGVRGEEVGSLNLDELPDKLREEGVSFVTLSIGGNLRGCIGALEASRPLAEDVQQHAIAAALNDYRFPPVHSNEIDDITIEISYLTPPMPLMYEDPADLINHLRPGKDGVVIQD